MVAECSAERVHVSSAPTLKHCHAARGDVESRRRSYQHSGWEIAVAVEAVAASGCRHAAADVFLDDGLELITMTHGHTLKTPSEFAFTCHRRRDLALRYVEGSAPAPVTPTAQQGKSKGELRTG
jgi:hypothetical protein